MRCQSSHLGAREPPPPFLFVVSDHQELTYNLLAAFERNDNDPLSFT